MKKAPYQAAFAAMLFALAAACSPAGTVPADPAATAAAAADAAAKTLAEATEADKAFAAATLKDGPGVSFAAWFDPTDSQFIAPGEVMKGAAAIAAGFAGSPGSFTIEWAVDGGHAASSGDHAVTTGRYTVKSGGNAIETGRYVSSWRKDAKGAWKVLLETTIPDPPAKPAAAPDPEGRPG
jgi:ketosteroid isomerase-like protein